MIQSILIFLGKHFMEVIIVALFGVITKWITKQFGAERMRKIEEIVYVAMCWAEETYGIGTGDQKWAQAWKKIKELLEKEGITLSKTEEEYVEVLMKSYVPEINSMVYQAQPEKEKENRQKHISKKEINEQVEYLRQKYGNKE